MPRYVEEHFIKASAAVGLKVEPRADGLWRIEHVLADLRSDRLQAVRKLGKPETILPQGDLPQGAPRPGPAPRRRSASAPAIRSTPPWTSG